MVIHNENIHYINGTWVQAEDLTLSVFDLTILRGYGVFDFVRSHNRNFVWLKDHLDRFFESAKAFQLPMPCSRKELEDIFEDALKKNPDQDIYVRVLLTGGISEDTLSPGRDNSLILIINYCKPIDSDIYDRGVAFATFSAPRQLPRIKSTNYTTSLYARNKLKHTGIMDVLLIGTEKDPTVYEAAVNNVFFIKSGVVMTAPTDNVLGGIMRQKAILALQAMHIPVNETFIHLSDIKDMDECFATNSSLLAYPVTRIDDITISDGCGPITREVLKAIRRMIDQESA